ncbi:EpsG family protein [Pedobacter nutrimenti]|nr:EpsG family protein [Pedobacter nutrimenti]
MEVFLIKKSDRLILFGLASFFLYALSFLRWETGTDWDSYLRFFNESGEWFMESEFEWGFARINEGIKIYFDNYSILLFVLATIIFSFQSKAILRLSPYPITSLLVLWSVFFGNIFFVRQTIATVILLYSIRFIQEKKFFRFLSLVGLAMLFHRTSFIFIFTWWVYKLKLKPITLYTCIAISMFISVAISTIMENLGGVIGGVVQQKLQFYMSDSENTMGSDSSLSTIMIKGFANKIFVFGASILLLGKLEDPDDKFRGYLNIYWAGVILYFSTISISIALVRLSFAFDIVMIIIIPFVLKNIKSYSWRFLSFLIMVLYLIARLYVTITGSYYDLYVPFKSIVTK